MLMCGRDGRQRSRVYLPGQFPNHCNIIVLQELCGKFLRDAIEGSNGLYGICAEPFKGVRNGEALLLGCIQ